MKEIINIIDQYIEKQNTNYAIMIDGEWGIGKTYFVLNDLKNHLEAKLGYENKPFKMIYISLNGLNKLDWITEQVILARLSPTKSANVAYGLVKSAFEVAGHIPVKGKLIQQSAFVASKQLRDNATNLFDFHNCVIVFDDLERIDPSLKIETVLGYINTNFIEHNYNKVILVADKEKISGKFNEVQEKFIDRIVKFEHDLESTIIDYIKSFLTIKSKYAGALKYIERDKDEILRMINIAQCKNLRTIRFVFELFSTVFETTKLTRMNDQMARAMFMFTLTISNEFKKGILPVRDKKYDLNELREIYSIFIKIRKVNDDSELNYSGVFCKKYLYNVNVEWKFFKSILDFIVNGTFDQDLFNKEMDYYTKQKEEWDQSLDDFFNYYNLELDRLSAISKKVLNYASYGKYTPSQYLAIYSNLQEHIAKEYIQLPIDYKEKLKTGLELSLKNHPDTFSMVNEFSNQYATSTYGNDPDFDEIFDTEKKQIYSKG
ncbi:P-loop NTPase fold protein [Paenibacillus elgii]|uniref:P-loop NTPase fold protein n=1 Tax=Paenibacillus elgii TaxID=189691 RepID=UPI000FD9061A|nr:P-loop NTPase fold protein [Paenibacillus elgii]NEN81266.1 hypothetical protein [Paenibacillus elgii]